MNSVNTLSRKFALLFTIVFSLIIVGCSGTPSPEDIVRNYYKAVDANRVDEAFSYYSLKGVANQDLTSMRQKLKGLVSEQNRELKKNGGLDSIQTTIVQQDGKVAVVKVVLRFKNGKTHQGQLKLVQDGGWKLSPM